MWPIEPVQAPLGPPSSSSIAARVTVFGHPVTEPPGNIVLVTSDVEYLSSSKPSTPLTRCCTFDSASILHPLQLTVPGTQTLLRSCLSRSTSIRCSEISFSLDTNSILSLESSSSSKPLFLVPLIGLVLTTPPSSSTSLSGLEDATDHPRSETIIQQEKGAGLERERSKKDSQGCPGIRPFHFLP